MGDDAGGALLRRRRARGVPQRRRRPWVLHLQLLADHEHGLPRCERGCVVDLFDELTDAADRGEPCPRCDSPTGPYTGFGLAGGGFGSYAGCYACDVFIKIRIPDDAQEDTQDGAE